MDEDANNFTTYFDDKRFQFMQRKWAAIILFNLQARNL